MVDARRGEVFWTLYEGEKNNGSDGGTVRVLRELRPPAVASPEVVAAELARLSENAGETVLALGDGAWRYRELFQAAGTEVAGLADKWPSPLAVAELGYRRTISENQSHRGTRTLPEPLYLRQADVRIGWEEVGGRVAGPRSATSGAALPSGAPKLAP